MLSLALVPAGRFDGERFYSSTGSLGDAFYVELAPISSNFQSEALAVNGLDRNRLLEQGVAPARAMRDASEWIAERSQGGCPVLVAYPLSFDWSWLYWYFMHYTGSSPFKHSRCFDIKTAVAVKLGIPIAEAGRKGLPDFLQPTHAHTHHAIDDAIAQAEIFAKLFELEDIDDEH